MNELSPDDVVRIAAAKLWLVATSGGDMPYLATAVYALTSVACNDVATATVDERWRLYINPLWLAVADIDDISAELAHLVWHLLRDHSGRAYDVGVGTEQAGVWRTASDATIAELLLANQLRTSLQPPRLLGLPSHQSAEAYYSALLDQPGRDHADSCGSGADGLPRPYEIGPDPQLGQVDPVHADELRRTVAIAFVGHVTTHGTQPGDFLRWVEAVTDPVVPWASVLTASVRRAVAWTAGNTHYSYQRPSRRAGATPGVVLPAMRRAVPQIAIVIDTSGSVDDGLLAQALGEVDGAIRGLGVTGASVAVLACDAAVHTVAKVRRASNAVLLGAGGTDIGPGIATAATLKPRPQVIIVLTDGYTPWPSGPPAGTTVIAAVLGRDRDLLPATPRWAQRVECV